eukprot:Rhum_TRINITY_DN10802_c0_g1::Rhum_TRINITY_DN10802_c0_g1_i1::g.40446::m.40446
MEFVREMTTSPMWYFAVAVFAAVLVAWATVMQHAQPGDCWAGKGSCRIALMSLGRVPLAYAGSCTKAGYLTVAALLVSQAANDNTNDRIPASLAILAGGAIHYVTHPRRGGTRNPPADADADVAAAAAAAKKTD